MSIDLKYIFQPQQNWIRYLLQNEIQEIHKHLEINKHNSEQPWLKNKYYLAETDKRLESDK